MTLNTFAFLHCAFGSYLKYDWPRCPTIVCVPTHARVCMRMVLSNERKLKGCLCGSLIEWVTWITVQQLI